MATVIRGDEVSLLEACDRPDIGSFLTHGEVRHTWDFPTAHELIDLVVEVADVLHLAVHL